MRRSWLISAFVVAVSSVACTALLGDFETSATAGDGGTTSGGPDTCDLATKKVCNGACVSREDPLAGCAAENCTPCAPNTNAAPACKAGGCSFTCNQGFSDCDGNPSNGCEAKTFTDPANCGKCGDACGAANTETTAKCAQGKCEFACKKGFGHCAPTNDTGCETNLLADPKSCGACGHSCLGGECKEGKCQPFQLASATSPSGVAVDKNHVYYTSSSQNYIQRVQHDGKCSPAAPCPQDFVSLGIGDQLSDFRGPSAIVSDGMMVWFTGQAISQLGRRSAVLPPGPATSPIKKFGPAQSTQPGYVVVAGGKIWWTNGFGNPDPAPHVRKADLDGSNVTAVAFYTTPVATFQGVGAITADATHIYWASENSGVYRAAFGDPPCTEGSTCKLVSGASGPHGIAVDASFVYWTEPASGSIRRAPKGGGSSVIVATGQASPRAIAVQGTFVYWANSGAPGSIRRAPQVAAVCDGDACEGVAAVAAPDALVAAEDGLYWTDNSASGGVYRLAK